MVEYSASVVELIDVVVVVGVVVVVVVVGGVSKHCLSVLITGNVPLM